MKQGMAFTVGSGIGEVPENAKRFFSAEVMDRWPGLSLQDILYLRADRDELILFLRMRYGFAPRRAASEAAISLQTFKNVSVPRSVRPLP